MALTEPAGRAGVVMVSVLASVTFTPVAATPPTVAVAPASNARPLTVTGAPLDKPDCGVEEMTNRGENSDVLPPGSVAVAVMGDPAGTATGRTTLKLTSPEPFVVAWEEPRYVFPSGRSWGRRAQTGSA